MGVVKAGVVLWRHEAIVLNGYHQERIQKVLVGGDVVLN